MHEKPWQVWIDTGGTFTDCLATDPEGNTYRIKVMSSSRLRAAVNRVIDGKSLEISAPWFENYSMLSGFELILPDGKSARIVSVENNLIHLGKNILNPRDHLTQVDLTTGEEAPILAARIATRTPAHEPLPDLSIKLGSTRGTNALLERKGAPVTLITNAGFEDLTLIGTQQRPDLFSLNVQKSDPLHQRVIGIRGRLDQEGKELNSPDLSSLTEELMGEYPESTAISFLHSYRNSAHEVQVEDQLRAWGVEEISRSSDLSEKINMLDRTQTAVVNAYLSPIMNSYLENIRKCISGNELHVMSSSGGLIKDRAYRAKDSLLSGPAGGANGARIIGRSVGAEQLITLDMGGTSTDVSLIDGELSYQEETTISGITLSSPSIAIETVAAGGGSICLFDGHKLSVGPESAGAYPGPACYGQGGPLTLTDVNLLLGNIRQENFDIPILEDAAREALKEVIGEKLDPHKALLGFREIGNQLMAGAIRKISVSRGIDPSAFALISFGGAGGQHACSVADHLGMIKILVPADAGLLSAYGIGQARIERMKTVSVLSSWENAKPRIRQRLAEVRDALIREMKKEGLNEQDLEVSQVRLFLRFTGQDHHLEIDYDGKRDPSEIYREEYINLFGHWPENRPLELEAIRVRVSEKDLRRPDQPKDAGRYSPQPSREIKAPFTGQSICCFHWEELQAGAEIQGPALVLSPTSTTVVEEGWSFLLDAAGTGLLNKISEQQVSQRVPEELELELYINRFRGIAADMGALLQRTSFSVNIKERLDFSCALLDPQGYLVVNAPHIPVHLGSMGLCTREVMKTVQLKDGDVIVTNHPAYGGSHLPDITLIAPVFQEHTLIGFVANRAHHAELGGKTPGSMPPNANNLQEEGIVIPPTYLVRGGKAQWEELEGILNRLPYPTRSPMENLADLNAALASIQHGKRSLTLLAERFGASQVVLFMKKIQEYAGELIKARFRGMEDGNYSAREELDDGTVINVSMELIGDSISIDFSGTDPVHPGNFNATPAIVNSAILYVLRIMIDKDLPLNEGLMQAVDLNLPECFLNPFFPENPEECPAVVGGNTETSQRVVDTLLKALKLAACSQGTMNNFLFGNEEFGYYETMGGGTGATASGEGSDAIHQHMTNTRITDPEILEFRYPVRLEQFSIRQGSGGSGKFKGGNGMIRSFRFLKPVEVTLLMQHRKQKPYGMNGGNPGKEGIQTWITGEGKHMLEGVSTLRVNPGDLITIETPGGGGWGS